MGANPLDAFLPEEAATKASKRGLEKAGTTSRPEKPEPVKKAKAAFYLPLGLMDTVRDAAYWTRLSLAELAAEALRREVARLAKKAGHKDGVFPKRETELKSGRPVR